jgi:hypothetical protein
MAKSTALTYRRLKATGRTRNVPGSVEREYRVMTVAGEPTKRIIWIDRRHAAEYLPDVPTWKQK